MTAKMVLLSIVVILSLGVAAHADPIQFTFSGKTFDDVDILTVTSLLPVVDGHPVVLDGVLEWWANRDGVVALFPADNGMTCDLLPFAVGSFTLTVIGDTNLSAGITTISGTQSFSVIDRGGILGFHIDGAQPAPVPEPATWLLLASGLALVGWKSRLRNDQKRQDPEGKAEPA